MRPRHVPSKALVIALVLFLVWCAWAYWDEIWGWVS